MIAAGHPRGSQLGGRRRAQEPSRFGISTAQPSTEGKRDSGFASRLNMATRPNGSGPQPPRAVRSPQDVVRAVIDCVCRSSVGDTAALADLDALYPDPTSVLHPMRPELAAVRTRDHFLRHWAAVSQRATSAADARRPVDLRVHTTSDPEVVITELKYEAIVGDQTPYTPCIWVSRVRDGRIIEARDTTGKPTRTEGRASTPADRIGVGPASSASVVAGRSAPNERGWVTGGRTGGRAPPSERTPAWFASMHRAGRVTPFVVGERVHAPGIACRPHGPRRAIGPHLERCGSVNHPAKSGLFRSGGAAVAPRPTRVACRSRGVAQHAARRGVDRRSRRAPRRTSNSDPVVA